MILTECLGLLTATLTTQFEHGPSDEAVYVANEDQWRWQRRALHVLPDHEISMETPMFLGVLVN